MIIKDTSIWWSAKKAMLQLAFIIKWIKKTVKIFWVFLGFNHISQIAKPIDKYKIIQTGANIKSGGLKEGLISQLQQFSY